MSARPTQLQYAPPPPRWQVTRETRGLLRVLFAVACCGAIVVSSRSLSAWVQGKYLREHWRHGFEGLMPYTAPKGQIVFERDPDRCKALLKSPGYFQLRIPGGLAPAAAASAPAAWQAFWYEGSNHDSAFVFLHERRFAGEYRMLVEVEYCPGRAGVGPHFAATLVEPGSFTRNGRFKFPDVACATPQIPLRITAGEVDGNDESHFTVRAVAADGVEDVYDGWLGPPKFEYRPDDLAKVRMLRRARGASEPAR